MKKMGNKQILMCAKCFRLYESDGVVKCPDCGHEKALRVIIDNKPITCPNPA